MAEPIRYVVSKGFKGGDFQRIAEITPAIYPRWLRNVHDFLMLHPEINDLAWARDDGICYVVKRQDDSGGGQEQAR